MNLEIGFGLGILVILAVTLLASAIRILREYERGVVFQLGRFWSVKGPGPSSTSFVANNACTGAP